MMLSAAFGDLPTIDLSGQPDVPDEHVGESPAAPLHAFFAVGSVDDIKAFLPEAPPRQVRE